MKRTQMMRTLTFSRRFVERFASSVYKSGSKADVLNSDFSIAFIQQGLQERLVERHLELNERKPEEEDDYGRTFPAHDDYDIFDAETKQILQESMAISHKKTPN